MASFPGIIGATDTATVEAPRHQIRGYSAMAEKAVDYTVAPVSGRPSETLVAHRSRPIIEMFLRKRDLPKTLSHIEAHAHDVPPKGADERAEKIDLIILDPKNPTTAIAFRSAPPSVPVVAAVLLSASQAGWKAEPLAIFNDDIAAKATLYFCSPSVTALLNLTEQCFSQVFARAKEAAARLEYLRQGGPLFSPQKPHPRKWRIASRWPVWQQRKLNFPAREHELAAIENRPERDDDAYLRKLCSREPLRLRESDHTDS